MKNSAAAQFKFNGYGKGQFKRHGGTLFRTRVMSENKGIVCRTVDCSGTAI